MADKQLNLFGEDPTPVANVPARFKKFPKSYQDIIRICLLNNLPAASFDSCAGCFWLFKKSYRSKNYYKCAYYRDTCGAGSDWRVGWPSCGLYVSYSKRMNPKHDPYPYEKLKKLAQTHLIELLNKDK